MSEDANKHTMLKSVKMYLDCYNKTVTTFVSCYKQIVFWCLKMIQVHVRATSWKFESSYDKREAEKPMSLLIFFNHNVLPQNGK